MTSPFRRPGSTKYYFRRAVPDDLRDILKKREIKISLNTSDPAEAKRRHAKIAAEIQEKWDRVREGVQPLNHRDAQAIAGEFYERLVKEGSTNPPQLSKLEFERMYDQVRTGTGGVKVIPIGTPEGTQRLLDRIKRQNRRPVERFLLNEGIITNDESIDRVVAAVNHAILQGRELLIRNTKGDYRNDPNADRFPKWEGPTPLAGRKPPERYDLVKIYDELAFERKHSPATIKKFRPIIESVAQEVPDIRLLTDEWCIAWKDRLLKSGLSTKSVQEGYLAALRNVTRWSKKFKRISVDPMDGVSILVKEPVKTRPEQGHTDEEARIVLQATLKPMSDFLPEDQRAARRWLPWLCLYTGARISEVARLRTQDLIQRNGIWLLSVFSSKTRKTYLVAVHSHLIEQGFVDFVQKTKREYLFCDLSRRKPDSESPVYKKTAENMTRWIRSLGVTDPELQPTHGFRHRFKTEARDVEMDAGTRDAMQGHARNGEGEKYGNFKATVLQRNMEKLPKFVL